MFPPRFRLSPTPCSPSPRRLVGRLTALAVVAFAVSTSAQGPAPATQPALRYAYPLQAPWVPSGGQPIVVDLDRNGEPEIIALAGSGFGSRRLMAIHGGSATVAFNLDAFQPGLAVPIVLGDAFSELAAGDLDGDGYAEIVAVDAHDGTAPDPFRRSVLALRPNGTPLWMSDDVVSDPLIDSTSGFTRPVIADLDADGAPEIVVGYAAKGPQTPQNVASEDYVTVFDNLGHIRWTARGGGTSQGASPTSNAPVVADIDLDGTLEVLFSDDVFNANGTLRRSINNVNLRVADVSVANFDDDPYPEILYLDAFGRLWLTQHDGTAAWGPVAPPGPQSGLGLPAIGDVTGDGVPEIVVVRWQSIEVLTGAGTPLFSVPMAALTYGGNVTLFDLNADGRAEIIFHSAIGPFDTASQKGAIIIVDGQSRTQHAIFAPRNGGDDQRGPIVADIDGDGSAEIVVRGYNENNLFRVYRANTGTWAQTRPIWNQFGFHVTHTRSNGTVPPRPPINWLTPGLNSFRANGFPETAQGVAPVPTADGYTTAAGSPITVPAPGVLGNDAGNGQTLRAALVGQPAHGTVTLSASGSFQYTPAGGYSGPDAWTYRPVTSNGAGALATVSMTVTASNTALPPTNLQVVGVVGSTVTLAWSPPSAGLTPTGYLLEGGFGPGQVIGSVPLGLAPGLTAPLPSGVLYLRVRTLAGASTSATSNEVVAYVNVPVAPAAPTNLLGLVVGNALTLTWQNTLSAGAPTGLVLDVSGAISGSIPLGLSESFSFPVVPAGSYTFAVRAANAAGTSAASNAVTLTFPTACSGAPQAPTGFTATKAGNVISIAWNPPAAGPAPTGYVLNVTGAFTGSLPLTVRALSAPVPPGGYTLSVAGANPCGVGTATASTTVTIP